jgi:hypothetical protein
MSMRLIGLAVLLAISLFFTPIAAYGSRSCAKPFSSRESGSLVWLAGGAQRT